MCNYILEHACVSKKLKANSDTVSIRQSKYPKWTEKNKYHNLKNWTGHLKMDSPAGKDNGPDIRNLQMGAFFLTLQYKLTNCSKNLSDS